MYHYLVSALIAICLYIPAVAQVKLIPIRDLSIATEALGIHASNLQLINGLFYAPAFNKLIAWDTTGREVRSIAHHHTRKRVNQNYFCRFLTIYDKDYYVSYYSWDYLHLNRLSDGKRILVTRIGNEKNKHSGDYAYPVQKIDGTKIVIAGNDFVSPQALFFKDRLIVPYRALAFLKTAKNKQGIINHHLTEYDTLNYLPHYPLFGIYDLKPMVNQLAERVIDAQEIRNNHLLPYVNAIGNWSEGYLKQGRKKQYYQFPDFHGMAYDMNSRDSSVIYAQSIDSSVSIIGLDGNRRSSFGTYGKHLRRDAALFTYVDPKEFEKLKQYSWLEMFKRFPRKKYEVAVITYEKSFRNVQINYDSLSNFIFRVYETPRYDLSLQEIRNIISTDSEKWDSLTRVNPKPHYLQIYDHNDGDRLIFDEAVPAPFHILEVKGDTLWVVAGMSEKGLKIVKYVVKKE